MNNIFKVYCLRIRLRKLRKKREQEMSKLILAHPGRIAKMDKPEDLDSKLFAEIDKEIIAYKRLIEKVKKESE